MLAYEAGPWSDAKVVSSVVEHCVARVRDQAAEGNRLSISADSTYAWHVEITE